MRRIPVILLLFLSPGISAAQSNPPSFSKQALIDDCRELIRTIESVHPDPYSRAGGKIAFHRLFQRTLEAIPDTGMSRDEFFTLMEPLVAAIGDAHTALSDPHVGDPYSPGGIPLYFGTFDAGLYVAAAFSPAYRDLLGAVLLSVEGVPFADIVERCRRLRGADNDYLLYQTLGGQGMLWQSYTLKKLLPGWQENDFIRIGLRLPNGSDTLVICAVPDRMEFSSIVAPPTTDTALLSEFMANLQKTDIFYQFLDSTHQTCLLVIRDLSTYREAFEVWRSYGVQSIESRARDEYRRYHGTSPPDNIDQVIAGLPSATDVFRSMAADMKMAGSKNLLIDLMENGGGNSLLSNILLYFLWGKDTVLSLKGRTTEIVKYSPEYFEKFPSPTLDEINADRRTPVTVDGYDFTDDYGGFGYPGTAQVTREFAEMLNRMPTFRREYDSGTYSGYYRPKNVLVLCNAGTFSAAFTVMYYLKQAGAEIVGTPSAQAGNCFGDIIEFTLSNSAMQYRVSRKYFELFPGDPERGRVLPPDHLMTYDIVSSYHFDPASIIWFSLDLLQMRDANGD